jgi:hypothetical protein
LHDLSFAGFSVIYRDGQYIPLEQSRKTDFACRLLQNTIMHLGAKLFEKCFKEEITD